MSNHYHVKITLELGKRIKSVETVCSHDSLKALEADKEYYKEFLSRCKYRAALHKIKTTAELKIINFELLKALR